MNEAKIVNLFDTEHTLAKDYLLQFTYPWEALSGIKEMIIEIGKTLDVEEYDEVEEHIWVSKTAIVAKSAYIGAPAIIGHGSEVRHGAYIRSSALVGEGCVVGNSVELKNVILFDGVQVPHYNYVGDSILGYKAHMGAGSITSNVKSDKTHVVVKDNVGGEYIDTERKKFGAALGDFCEVGCNAVLNPGSVLGRGVMVYPTSCVRGVIYENHIFKCDGSVVEKKIL